MSVMNKYQKFRFSFPFYRMDVNGFMKLINDARRILTPDTVIPLYEIKYINLASMQEAFKENAMWSDELKDDQTKLVKLLNATCIYRFDPDNGEIVAPEYTCYDIRAIRAWAVLFCDGDPKEKVPELYDMLQDNNQPSISATDKDFNVTMTMLFDFAGYTIDRHYDIVSDEEAVRDEMTEEELEAKAEKYDEKFEELLDELYGYESKLDRSDWESGIVTKGKYLFDPAAIREKIDWK